jgi:hypothetical protein
MIIRHTIEQVNEYYERIGINQSSLKVLIEDGIEKYLSIKNDLQRQNDLYYEEKKYFIIGNAVDCRITHGEEVFKNSYFFSQLQKKPGEKGMSVIKLAFDKAIAKFPKGPDVNINLFKKEIYEAANEEEYYIKRKKPTFEEDERILTLLKDNGQAYWMDLALAEGKQVLNHDENLVITAIVMSLLTHKFTRHLFVDDATTDIVFQLPMYWSYKEVDCKGLVDMIIINHATKKIFIIDIKTLGDYITRFNKAARKRRYDLQGAFYTLGLKLNLPQLGTLINRNLDNYEVANFAFVVESTIKPGTPLIFPLTDELMEQGANGSEDILGYNQAIDLYKEWEGMDFSLEKKVEENNGVVFLGEDYNYNLIF